MQSHAPNLAMKVCTEVVTTCGAAQGAALAAATEPFLPMLAEGNAEPLALSGLLAAFGSHLPLPALAPVVNVLARNFEMKQDTRAPLLTAATAIVHRISKHQGDAMILAGQLVHGLAAAVWTDLDAGGRATARIAALVSDEVVSFENAEELAVAEALSLGEKRVAENWTRLVHECGKVAPGLLSADVLQVACRAAASLLATPQKDPPDRTLAFLSEWWKAESGVGPQLHAAMQTCMFEPAWPLGALILRGTCKALLGQMPPGALGVVVPAARGMFQHRSTPDSNSGEAWLRHAVAGDAFPSTTMKPEVKERYVKELASLVDDVQKFKSVLKRFCGGKKKGVSSDT